MAEKMNRTLLDRVRCMLYGARLSKFFWDEAVMIAGYLIYRIPSIAIGFKTPEELWTRKPANYSFLRVFGCATYAHQSE